MAASGSKRPSPSTPARPSSRPARGPSATARPAAKKPVTKKPVARKPAGKQPAARPAAATPTGAGGTGGTGQTIWLAGLGALARAQAEGTRLFETLVKAGVNFDTRVRKNARAQAGDFSALIGTAGEDLGERSRELWKRIDGLFQERLDQATAALPLVRRSELQALAARLDELARSVDQLQRSASKAAAPAVRTGAAERRPVAHAVKRVRDELADVAKELENAQIAARAPARKTGTARKG
ncbi:phasin family protein [Dokdonella koreensis]|uniref:Poly(Hydroxyalkanoate) granule-associated protein n=1 Tax=Dokdonella koreensis DS-123 TaxID=1300342 RepID=A0A160DTL1_9GAMM|nr:phasin family protein [Dokdonella koreensis]ANB17718.1 Poly(Hydroxyalkanoate) granule-associated protein [Dokdonella koreensis DS-123]